MDKINLKCIEKIIISAIIYLSVDLINLGSIIFRIRVSLSLHCSLNSHTLIRVSSFLFIKQVHGI